MITFQTFCAAGARPATCRQIEGNVLANPDRDANQRQEDDGCPGQAELGVAQQHAHDDGQRQVEQGGSGNCAAADHFTIANVNGVRQTMRW